MTVRDHEPIEIDEFNGLWKRGDADSCPRDHFPDCNNIAYIQSGFRSRDGIDPYLAVANIVRSYTFTKQSGESLLLLDSNGNFYDSDFPTTIILTVSTATDFGFLAFDGRAYISPCDGNTGIASEYVYVYKGDGTAARRAAGAKPVNADGALAAANSATAGNVEAGVHIFAVVYETDTGFLTALGPDTLPTVTADGTHKVDLSNISVSPNAYVTKRHIVATQLILPSLYTGNTRGYQFFFVPDGVINDNTTTTLTVNFFDDELIEDASYLLDIFETIPAVAGLGLYHNRMTAWATSTDPSIEYISNVGEPESINSVDGLIIFPLDGNPITSSQEYRDVLYVFKKTKTNAWSDNGDVPASWPMTVIDNGTGCTLHGIGKVLDSEGVNIDYLIVGGIAGIYTFEGTYLKPELSWKIFDLWNFTIRADPNFGKRLQILNDSVNKIIYIVLPDGTMLMGDYSNGLDFKNIRWSPWSFDIDVRSISILSPSTLILASDGQLV